MAIEQHIPNKPLAFGFSMSKPFMIWAVLSFIFVAIAAALDLSMYYLFKQIIDTAEAFSNGKEAAQAVLIWIVLYPVVIIGEALFYRASARTGMLWITKMQKKGRDTLFDYLSKHSTPYFSSRFAGSLSSRIWNATDGAGRIFRIILWEFFNQGVGFIGAIFLIYLVSPILVLVFIGWMTVLGFVSYFLAKRNRKFAEIQTEQRTKVAGIIVDIVTNMNAVQQFARIKYENKHVQEETDVLRKAAVRSSLGNETMLLVGNVVMGMFIISMLGGAFFLWSEGSITTGSFILLLTLMGSLYGWFGVTGSLMNSFAGGYGEVAESLKEILVPHDLTDFPKAKALVTTEGAIEFKNVGFSYGTHEVFKNFNLKIKPSERIGVVGPSGAGKTSFVSLLLRQQDVHEGQINIDEQNIRKVQSDSLRSAIAVVPQENSLFHRSIRENIAYGKPDATQDEIEEAAKKAQAHSFIGDTSDGYSTLVGERGVKLSGGQRQRVAIARAILKAAPILVLDEATSSLDSESEVQIQNALHELMEGKTVIAIAHRLSTLREMDRILVLENGQIVQDGTHDELVQQTDGLYARLWNHQAGGFLQED